MLATCFSTVPSETTQLTCDGGVGTALSHERQHVFLPGAQRRDRTGPSRRPTSWLTTSGSRAVPPDATRTRASTKSPTSATRSFRRYPTPAASSANSWAAYRVSMYWENIKMARALVQHGGGRWRPVVPRR